mgnify:CR=1 FL=1
MVSALYNSLYEIRDNCNNGIEINAIVSIVVILIISIVISTNDNAKQSNYHTNHIASLGVALQLIWLASCIIENKQCHIASLVF